VTILAGDESHIINMVVNHGGRIMTNENESSNEPVTVLFNMTHLQAWLNSPIRNKPMQPINEIADADSFSEATGLETWFDIPGQKVSPPPMWKMVITTFIAIYPISLIYGAYVATHVTGWPLAFRSLFLPVFAPIILTYLFMPFLTKRVLKRWLYQTPSQ
jgi:uncharacterized protein